MTYRVLNDSLQLIARIDFWNDLPIAVAVTPEGHDIITWTKAGVPALQGSETATGIDEQPMLVPPSDPFWGLAFLEEAERRDWTVRGVPMEEVLKRNVYHDAAGLFTTKERAASVGRVEQRTLSPGWYKSFGGHHVEVGEGGVIAGGTHAGKVADMKKFMMGPFQSHAEAKATIAPMGSAQLAENLGHPLKPPAPEPPPQPKPVPPPPKPVPIPPPPPAVSQPQVTPQVVKNLTVANLNEYDGKEKLQGTQTNVKNIVAKIGKTTVNGEETKVNPSTGLVEVRYAHQFFSTAKAQEAFNDVRDFYHDRGHNVTDGKPTKPGEVNLIQQGSRIMVMSVHAPKADPKPPVVSEQAKKPPVTVAQPPKPLTAAQQTAKEKHQAKMLEKYQGQYESEYVTRVVDALNLKSAGQNAKAKTKLAPLQNLEKTLVQYGITPENLKALQEKVQMVVEHKATENFQKVAAAHLASTRANAERDAAKKSYDSTSPLYQKALVAQKAFVAARDANPGLLQKRGGQSLVGAHTKATMEFEKFKALQQVVATIPPVALTAEALKAHKDAKANAKSWGATDEDIDKAVQTPSIRETLAKPIKTFATVAEAAAQVKDVGTAYHAGKEDYDYYASEEKKQQMAAKDEAAQVKYALAKASYLQSGGDVPGLTKILAEAEQAGTTQKYAAQKAKKAAQVKMKNDLTTASHDYMQAHFEHGGTSVQAIAAQKKLEDLKSAAQPVLSTQSDVDAAVLQGKHNWDQTIKTFKDTAASKVKSAMFAYEYAVLENAPADKIAELKRQLEHAQKTDEKYFPKTEMDAMAAEQKAVAKTQKEANDRLKSLGQNIQAKLKTHDQSAADFTYPEGDAAKGSAFSSAQKAQIPKLTSAEKDYLRAYTGNSFTPLNRAAGKFGSTGEVPDPETRAKMQLVDSAMAKITLGANVRLNRAMAQKYIANAFGLGDTLQHLTEAQLQDLVGKTYTEGAYSSTSMKPGWSTSMASTTSKTGKILLKIRAGKEIHGIRVASFSQHPEGEVLLARGTTYVIRSIKKVGSAVEMEVDIVGQIPKPLPGAKVAAPSVELSMEDLEDVDPGITVVDSMCHVCAHRDKQTPTVCAAFPEGIPLIIYMGQYDHTQPYMEDGEIMDGGLRFEPLTNDTSNDTMEK